VAKQCGCSTRRSAVPHNLRGALAQRFFLSDNHALVANVAHNHDEPEPSDRNRWVSELAIKHAENRTCDLIFIAVGNGRYSATHSAASTNASADGSESSPSCEGGHRADGSISIRYVGSGSDGYVGTVRSVTTSAIVGHGGAAALRPQRGYPVAA
jgi:hypothetical protein